MGEKAIKGKEEKEAKDGQEGQEEKQGCRNTCEARTGERMGSNGQMMGRRCKGAAHAMHR